MAGTVGRLPSITIATQPPLPVQQALGMLQTYSTWRTIPRYDLGQGYALGGPNQLIVDDLRRTQVVNSRMPRASYPTWIQHGQSAPWAGIAPGARLGEPRPAVFNAEMAGADALYHHFFRKHSGMATATLSKVLHLKRPGFYPILDSKTSRLYRQVGIAKMQATGLTQTPALWLCVRDDLLREENQAALAWIRGQIAAQAGRNPALANVQLLTDLRILDIIAWNLPLGGGPLGGPRLGGPRHPKPS
jgi:Family of unknown function (DUF6308)